MEQCQNTSITRLFVLFSCSQWFTCKEVEHGQMIRLRDLYQQRERSAEERDCEGQCRTMLLFKRLKVGQSSVCYAKATRVLFPSRSPFFCLMPLSLETGNSLEQMVSDPNIDPCSPSPFPSSWCSHYPSDEHSRCWNICANCTAVGYHVPWARHGGRAHLALACRRPH